MNDQHQFDNRNNLLPAGVEGGEAADRLAEVRAELGEAFAAADAILEGLRAGDNERFLERVRQSGGQ